MDIYPLYTLPFYPAHRPLAVSFLFLFFYCFAGVCIKTLRNLFGPVLENEPTKILPFYINKIY